MVKYIKEIISENMKAFTDNSSLKSNTDNSDLNSHTDIRPYQCCNCNRVFSNSNNSFKHVVTYSEYKSYQCSDCDKESWNLSLTVCIRICKAEKPYKCNQCDKGFLHNDFLIIGLKRHIGENLY